MKKTKGKRLPKPVTAWANYRRGVLQAVCVSDAINRLSRDNIQCELGHEIVRVRITPITPKKRRAKR